MRKWLFVLVGLLCCWPVFVIGQEQRFRIMTYNVENLFDTCHDEGFNDYEFLPNGSRAWNSGRYWGKQGRLARLIAAVGEVSPVDMVALCEVENDSVIRDLVERTLLRRSGYAYVMTKSKDARGIDVALLYQPFRFHLLRDTALEVPLEEGERATRPILHVCGSLPCGDTLDVFVNHWPSRRGDSGAADALRWRVAKHLRCYADSVAAKRNTPNIVMMGDFNADYRSKSIADGLGAVAPGNPGDYVVLSARMKAENGIRGTYKYKGEWGQLDQFIVHRHLLDISSRLHISPQKCRIVVYPFLYEREDHDRGVRPRRTYLGTLYKGGWSDHFPLLLELNW